MHQYVSTVEDEPDHLSRRTAGPPTAGSIHLTLEDMFSGWKSIAVFLDDTPKGETHSLRIKAICCSCRFAATAKVSGHLEAVVFHPVPADPDAQAKSAI